MVGTAAVKDMPSAASMQETIVITHNCHWCPLYDCPRNAMPGRDASGPEVRMLYSTGHILMVNFS